MPFEAHRDIPIWLAAGGTITLALIALFTLRPVVENLKLRDHNLELSEKNRQLQQKIETSQGRERGLNIELEILDRQREAATEEIKNLNRQREASEPPLYFGTDCHQGE